MILVAPWMLVALLGFHAWSCADETDAGPCSFCREVYGR